MGKASPSLFVSVLDRLALIRVLGRANFTLSMTFKTLVQELRDREVDRFGLDLTECITMDSTFLGVLTGMALKLNGSAEAKPSQSSMTLLNPNARIVDLIENLGVSHLFCVSRLEDSAGAQAAAPVEEAKPSREEISRTCLEAHQLLMEVNPENVPKFKEVTQFLAEDLKNLRARPDEGGPPPAGQAG